MLKPLFNLLLLLVCCVRCGNALAAQDALAAPTLKLSGPAGQTVVFSVRYFDGAEAINTVETRVDLPADGTPLEPQALEFGHTGIRIQIAVATAQPFAAQLFAGDEKLGESQSNAMGVLELQHGSVPEGDEMPPPRALPNQSEQQLIRSFLAAIPTANTRPLVSTLPLANIDWQNLDAYCAALTRELGQPLEQDPGGPLEGWITWEGSLDARVLGGQVAFEHGHCKFTLMAIDGKLVDVEPSSAEMPADWLRQAPASIEEYVQRSNALAEALLGGDVVGAQLLFSSRYHEEVTVKELSTLSVELRELVDEELPAIEFKRSEFQAASADSNDKQLSIDSVLQCGNGERWISRVDFIIPSGPDLIARAHLASIHFRQAWQSASPAPAADLTELLNQIGSEDPHRVATRWSDRLHPDLKPFLELSRLTGWLEEAAERLGALAEPADFDRWLASSGPHSTAVGPVRFAKQDELSVRTHWNDDKLLGITLLGDHYAASTLDLVPRLATARQHGIHFWKQLLGGDVSGAHQRLAPSFREQLPLDRLRELLAASGLDSLPPIMNIEVDAVRVTDRDSRPLPVMFTIYYVAHLQDDEYLTLSCEFAPRDGTRDSFDLLNFSTDVQATFPIAAPAEVAAFLDAFLKGDVEAVSRLTSATNRALIDPAILEAFLAELRHAVGNAPASIPLRTLRKYTDGRQLLQFNGVVPGSAEGSVVVDATMERGVLKRFRLEHPALDSFVDRVQDFDRLDARANEFLQAWLTDAHFAADPSERLEKFFVADRRTPAAMRRLGELHRELNVTLGALDAVDEVQHRALPDFNWIEIEWRLQFENGTRHVRLTYQLDAFHGLIDAVELLP